MKNQKEPKGTSEDQLGAELDQLSTLQIRFLIVRNELLTDKAAAEAIGISPSGVKKWPKHQKAALSNALRLMAQDGLVVAQKLRRRNLAKAMGVKVKGLDSENERLRQNVSTEIIEWEMGKASQPIETEHTGEIRVRWIDDWRTNDQATESA